MTALAPALHAIDPTLTASPKVNGSIFRIHRDTRFSKDKRPFKEELGFRFPAAGPKGEVSGFMLRIRPDLVGIGVGIWAFERPALVRFRAAVAEEASGAPLAGLLDGLAVNGCSTHGAQLKRVPRPHPPEHPRGDLLRLKGLVAGLDEPLPPSLATPAFVDWVATRLARLAPLHAWLMAHVAE